MQPLKVQLNTPIGSVNLTDGRSVGGAKQDPCATEALNRKMEKAASLCAALQSAIAQVEQVSRDIFVSHREQIVRLSIEIAAKILARDIHQRNYDIESIILQGLQAMPAAQRFTVRLHPDDLEVWHQAVKDQTIAAPDNVLCIGDPSVQRAECIIETDQGVVEYLIEEQLKQVAAALLGAEACVETAS